MHETPEDLRKLQELLDASFLSASQHLLSIMEPQRQLSAEQLAADLPSPAVLNLATVTASAEPRVSAVDGHFLRGTWYFTTAPEAVKAKHIMNRSAVSAGYTPKDGYGVFCHGHATLIDGDEKQELLEHLAVTYGTAPEDWAPTACYRIDCDWLTGFSMTDEEFEQIERARTERDASQR